jgi:hypothetical protein
MDLDRDGTDEIVMPLPDGEPRGFAFCSVAASRGRGP